MKVIKYNESYKEIWDLFVSKAKNTHFFFYRDYMEYHKDRFEDFSLMFWDDKNKLIAIMPASVKDNVVTSHGGLTFGGILSDKKMTASIMLVIFDTIKEFLLENDYATENNADEMASEVRRIMGKYDFTEEDAIFEVIEKYKN